MNTFKLSFSLYDAKTKMKNVDYSKLKKREINILLSQLCRSDKMNKFLNMNDFCDSGMEFAYEWVKCQLKIYFYLYQNNLLPKIRISKSISDVCKNNYKIVNDKNNMIKNYNINYNYEDTSRGTNFNSSNCNEINNQKQIMENLFLKNSTRNETNNFNNNISISNNLSNNISNINSNINNYINDLKNNNILKRNNSNNFYNINKFTITNSPLLLTSLPKIRINNEKHIDESTYFNNLKNKKYIPIEPKKVNIKLKGFNKEKEKFIKELRTAEMLPLLKNKTFHQMRNYFNEKIPFNKKIDKKMKMEINSYSLNGTNDEKKLISLIASGKIKALNYESLFKLKKTLGP